MKTNLILSALVVSVSLGCGDDSSKATNNGDNAATNGSPNGGTNGDPNGATNGNTPVDSDDDGLSDDEEEMYGTDPNNPDSDGDGLSDGDEIEAGTDPTNPDTDGDDQLDGSEVTVGSDPTTADEACGLDRYTASLEEKPVDIIIVIDNSGSMGDEIAAVEDNINVNFADIIRASGLDFRVIMISAHGEVRREAICVSEPLSGTSCDPVPDEPANTANFFHYDEEVSSHDSLEVILETWDQPDRNDFAPDGWRGWLRQDAFKVFVEITDDDPDGDLPDGNEATAENFEAALFALTPSHFGTAGDRNYLWHSIIGLAENNDMAWLPGDAIVDDECDTGESAAPEYQKLSIATGGLRYPVCAYDSYDVVFNEIAEGIIEQSKIACELELPDTPDGEEINPDSMILEWTPTPNDPTIPIPKVDEGACGDDTFYLDGDTIMLCPTFCDEVAASTEGKLSILAGCQSGDECVPTSDFENICDDGIDNDCDGAVDREELECLQ